MKKITIHGKFTPSAPSAPQKRSLGASDGVGLDQALFDGSESAVDRQTLIGWWDQGVLYRSRILVVGAGAIGNEVLKNLALIGAGNVFIADMDHVSTSNLSRTVLFTAEDVGLYKAEVAARRFREMSVCPTVKVDFLVGNIVTDLGEGIFRQFDLVIGCLDNLEARLCLNRRCNLLKLPYIDGGIYELVFGLYVHHFPYSSCFRCAQSSADIDRELARTRHSCDGKRKLYVQEQHAPTLIVSTSMVAALAVQEAVKILHKSDQVRYGVLYHFDGATNRFQVIDILRKSDEVCGCHYSYEAVLPTPFSNEVTLKEFLDWFRSEQGGSGEYYVDLLEDGTSFTTTGSCLSCGCTVPLFRRSDLLYRQDFYCEDCRTKGRASEQSPTNGFENKLTELYASDESVSGLTLAQLGIPKGHIVKVRRVDEDEIPQAVCCELSGDLPFFLKNIEVREQV